MSAVISVVARPGSRRNGVYADGDRVVVSVTAPAREGKANAAVIALLAERLGVPKRDAEIIGGRRGRQKRVRIHGVSAEDAMNRLRGGGAK